MPDYRVTVDGEATVRFEGESGLTREQDVRDDDIVVPQLPDVVSDGPVAIEIETIDSYECPHCGKTHTDYEDQGTTPAGPDARGGYELVECGNCGETIEFGVL